MANQYKTPSGKYPRRLMSIYYNMKDRCYNKRQKFYHLYGGRGITVCEQWLGEYGALNFYEWAMGYGEQMSLDRVNNNLGYSPANCRFVPNAAQSANRRVVLSRGENHHIEFLPYRGFRVQIQKDGIRYRKIFKTLQRAIEYRDSKYEEVIWAHS